MTYKTHIAGGLLASAAYLTAVNTSAPIPALCFAACAGILGSLLPDIDHANSKISQAAKPVNMIVDAISVHRGMFHAPLLYLSILIIYVELFHIRSLSLSISLLFIGIFSHLFLDMLNPAGIPLLWPIKQKHFRLAKIRTGGKREVIFRCVLWILLVALVVFKIFL